MKLLIPIICFLQLTFVVAQSNFQVQIGGSLEDIAYSCKKTADGAYIIAGRTFSFGTGGWEGYVTKFNTNADTVWTRTFGNSQYDELKDIELTNDGGYIAVGHTTTNDWDGNVYLIKLSATGTVLWSKEYGGAIGLSDKGYSVCQTNDGGYAVTGTTETYGAGGDDVYVLKVNSTGSIVWTAVIGSANTTSTIMDAGREIQETSDGGLIVVGYTSAVDAFSDVYLIKLNSNGSVQWKKTFGGNSYDIGYTVQQTSDNGFIIGATTNSFGAGNWDSYLIKTDENGTLLWSKTYGKSGEDRLQCARQTANGGYILCGRTQSFGSGSFDALLQRTDASGNLLWTKAYGGSADDQGFSVIEDGTSFIFCGYTSSSGAGSKDFFLFSANSDGNTGCNEITGTGISTTNPVTLVSTAGNLTSGGSIINPITAVRFPNSIKSTSCITPICSVNAGNDIVVCQGAAITLNATGSTSYSWSNGIQNGVPFIPTTSQLYSVVGTLGSCTSSDQIFVTVNNIPIINAGIDQSLCVGDSATLLATGADVYSWNNGISNGIPFEPATTTTYTVSGTNSLTGCSSSDQVLISVNDLPLINAGADKIICSGYSVILEATGGVTYSWNNNVQNGISFNPVISNVYSVVGTDANGCENTDNVLVTVNYHSSSTNNQTAINSFTWSANNQTYFSSGTYSTIILNAVGCDSTLTLNLTIQSSGTEELNEISTLVYPNPTIGLISVEIDKIFIGEKFSIMDQLGKIIFEGEIKNEKIEIDISHLSNGLYFFKFGRKTAQFIRIIKG